MKIENLTVSCIESAMMTVKECGYVYRNRCRNSNGLMIVRRGRLRYFQGEKSYISDRGHVLLIPAGADYSLVCDEDSETYALNFISSPISDEILSFEANESFFDGAELIISGYDGEIGERLAGVGMLYSILAKLLGSGKKEMPKIIKKGVEYIDRNFPCPDLTVKNAAKAAGVSEVYFRRIFGEYFGVSPLTYIREKRMAQAKRKMSDRSLTLESIACDCGYSSIYSFSAAFKKKEGVSPSKYREKYGEL